MLWDEAIRHDPNGSGTINAPPRAISPLRQRMIDDLRMRKLSEKKQSHYIRCVRRFAAYLGRSPDTEALRTAGPLLSRARLFKFAGCFQPAVTTLKERSWKVARLLVLQIPAPPCGRALVTRPGCAIPAWD
jgi:hypothetical protein